MHLPAFRLSVISRVNCGSVPRLWSISVRLGGELSCRKNPSRITAPTPSDFRYGSRSDTSECETYTIMMAFTTGILLLFTCIRLLIHTHIRLLTALTLHMYIPHCFYCLFIIRGGVSGSLSVPLVCDSTCVPMTNY